MRFFYICICKMSNKSTQWRESTKEGVRRDSYKMSFFRTAKRICKKGLKTRVNITIPKKGKCHKPFRTNSVGATRLSPSQTLSIWYYTRELRKVNNRAHKKEPPVSSFRLYPRGATSDSCLLYGLCQKLSSGILNIRRGTSVIVR